MNILPMLLATVSLDKSSYFANFYVSLYLTKLKKNWRFIMGLDEKSDTLKNG